MQQRLDDLSSPAASLLKGLLPRDPTLETLKLAERWAPAKSPELRDGVWSTPQHEGAGGTWRFARRARQRRRRAPGRLVSLREVALFEEYVDHLEGELDVHAEWLYADDGGAQYAFRVEHRGRLLCRGRAAAIHPPT
ncbi:hypothetical protein [Rhodanobacter lindaniclasticus]